MENLFSSCDKDITKAPKSNLIFRLKKTHLPCAHCASTEQKLGAGKGPHTASLRCGECDRFIKWIGKSELAKIENQGGHR
jgi:hypothetical protein